MPEKKKKEAFHCHLQLLLDRFQLRGLQGGDVLL